MGSVNAVSWTRTDGDRGDLAGAALPQRPHWWSADTAPEAFAVTRSVWLAPAFLILFVGISALIVPFLDELQEAYVEPLALVTNKSSSSCSRRAARCRSGPSSWP